LETINNNNKLCKPCLWGGGRGLHNGVVTWGGATFQGLGCSPIKTVHELGSKHCETIRSIFGVGIRALKRPFPSMKGPRRTHLWRTSYTNPQWTLGSKMQNG